MEAEVAGKPESQPVLQGRGPRWGSPASEQGYLRLLWQPLSLGGDNLPPGSPERGSSARNKWKRYKCQ